MKFNFKKISAVLGSVLLTGMSAGVAMAANYPAPFVSGSTANVAVVYGTGAGVSALDVVQAGNIQSNLQSYMGGSSTGGDVSTSGEVISLDTSSTRIWLNTSLNTAKSTLTKTDLPTVLADYTFSGDVEAKITQSIKLQTGATAGGDNSGKVIFERQPSSSDDPVIGISLGSSATSSPLYNASATMKATNFTHADSIGEEIMLFGQKFTVSSSTSASNGLVLLKEAEKFSLDSDTTPSQEVTIDGQTYTVELVSASDDAATIKVTNSAGVSESKEVAEANSKKINGLEIAIQTADETNFKLSASVIAGAQKMTFAHGTTVTTGSDNDPIDGTQVYLVGGVGALNELAVTVYRPDSSNDAIVQGESFTDPVFGSFKVDFAGLSSPFDDAGREEIKVMSSGDDSMSLTMTDDGGYAKTFIFAHNQSQGLFLGDSSNYTINVMEMSNLSEQEYLVLGNEDYGHLLQVTQIYNNTGSDYTNDQVKFRDIMSGETYATSFTSECSSGSTSCGTVDIEGKRYTVSFIGSGDTGYAQVKYPTSDSASANAAVIYPSIQTKNGAKVMLYQPMVIDLDNFDGGNSDLTTLNIPDGDGYTPVTLAYAANGAPGWDGNWTITGAGTTLQTNATADAFGAIATIGQLVYNFTSTAVMNQTKLYLVDPETTGTMIDQPAVIILEGKDDQSYYHAVVIDLETSPVGNSNDGVGVGDVLFSSDRYHASATLQSDSDMTKDVDWYGVLTTLDASDSDQKSITVNYPANQVFAQIYLGEADSSVSSSGSTSTSATQLGDILVKDTEVSSVSSKNLIIVGGSCINSAAATVLGGAYCGASFTEQTGVGSGQFLIQGFSGKFASGKMALVVAGYEAADTVNAATYLRNKVVDTSKKYVGTSATSAELVTTSE